MRDAVKSAFVPFTTPLEGVVPWLYQDVKGLVSIGIGNLVDPIVLAMVLPLVRADGTPAQRDEIAAEWLRVKNQGPDGRGRTAAELGHTYARKVTTLHLTDEGIERLVGGKLDQMDRYLAARFPEYPGWPADAQLGTLSMAWACGPAFRFPKLEAALRACDFDTAAVECFMPEEATISGLRPRNKANRVLFRNATRSPDPDVLFWPRDLASEANTLPQFDVVHPCLFTDDDDPPETT
jgi:GH24 family phage-related lysozyme (muramidase)